MKPSCEAMFEAGVHIGHQVKRWNPKFSKYLYKHLYGISIIDLERTSECLESAANFLTDKVKCGANVLLLGTKQQAQDIIRDLGVKTEMPFCANRWLGGCLTNFRTIKASLDKYIHFLEIEKSGELAKMLKKESSVIRRKMTRMHRGFEGLLKLKTLPDVLFVIDTKKEYIAVNEAKRLGIPVIGIVDTNSDPTLIDFPIPANDDAVRSLSILMEYFKDVILNGIELRKTNKFCDKSSKSELGGRSWTHHKRPFEARSFVDNKSKKMKIADAKSSINRSNKNGGLKNEKPSLNESASNINNEVKIDK